jgi:hypothetical protein
MKTRRPKVSTVEPTAGATFPVTGRPGTMPVRVRQLLQTPRPQPKSTPPPGLRESNGQPLPDEVRLVAESRLQTPLHDVRLHTGPEATRSTELLATRAYTYGRDVVVGAHAPSLSSPAGQHLLHHELTHVAQAELGSTGATSAEEEAEAQRGAAGCPGPLRARSVGRSEGTRSR